MPSRFPTAVLRQCDCESNCGSCNGATPKQSDTLQGKASPRHDAYRGGVFSRTRVARYRLKSDTPYDHPTTSQRHAALTVARAWRFMLLFRTGPKVTYIGCLQVDVINIVPIRSCVCGSAH